MKVAIVNYTGTVGKTTVAAHCFAPRMDGAQILAIESINEVANADGLDVSKVRGEKFRAIYDRLMESDNLIVDVGASNVEDFLAGMKTFKGSYEEIDQFVVPVTSGIKEQRETMIMLDVLSEFGIQKNKVHLVFNRVKENVFEEFPRLIEYAKKNDNCIADPRCAIYENELFDLVGIRKITVSSLVQDKTDYRSLIRNEKDADMRAHFKDMHIMKSLAVSVDENLNEVFNCLFFDETVAA